MEGQTFLGDRVRQDCTGATEPTGSGGSPDRAPGAGQRDGLDIPFRTTEIRSRKGGPYAKTLAPSHQFWTILRAALTRSKRCRRRDPCQPHGHDPRLGRTARPTPVLALAATHTIGTLSVNRGWARFTASCSPSWLLD